MLDNNRIKEAESNVRVYINDGLLRKERLNREAIRVLLKNAEESLMTAQKLGLDGTSDLWVIVCSYYSMFYISNAVLRTLGWKVEEKIAHKVTADTLIVYVKGKLKSSLIEEYENAKEEALTLAGLKADSIVESFDREKDKRSKIQYTTDDVEKKSKAQTSLKRAKEFVGEMKKFLIDLNR